jgi:hypothetical protein
MVLGIVSDIANVVGSPIILVVFPSTVVLSIEGVGGIISGVSIVSVGS